MKDKMEKINDYEWLLPKSARKEMRVDGKLFGNQAIFDQVESDTMGQLSNVCCLPGVIEPVAALPDAHFGYGLPMGAVAAFDAEEGVISSGLCGFDINCGINSIRSNLMVKDIEDKKRELVTELFKTVPCGVGSKGKLRLDDKIDDVLELGAKWAVENGYGTKKDLDRTEEGGCMQGADPKKVSELAKKRGRPQCGTLGAGNHFLEIQRVAEVFDETAAKEWGIDQKDSVAVMLHCGSRGLGHQVASDYLKIQEQAVKKYNIWLPDRQLACAPATSDEGQDYFSAMKCAVNYAFANRLIMTHWIRETFEKVFGQDWESMELDTIYAIAHNVVKKEEHRIDGKKKEIYVHRKGATRAFPDIPVLIAGTMGTSSYICKGTEIAMEKSFGSSCHGAGRAMSRHAALKGFKGEEVSDNLLKKGIVSKATNWKSLAEEAPGAYKDVDEVIESVHGAGISPKVVKLEPLGVLKG
ncbi:RtcB family protein [Candidatus Woesearchaeota archaeon]|nr:RtcB family protein [Candidatus Woesearchaeota archaeon]